MLSITKNKLIEAIAEEFAELKRLMLHTVSAPLGQNVPPAQSQLLFLVAKRGSLTVKEIALELRISSGAVTQLVDGLVISRLITREQDEKDRRIVHILLSEKGTEQVEEVRRSYLASFAFTVGTLSETELATLLTILQKVNRNSIEKKAE